MTVINLCNVPNLSSSYEHVLDFASVELRRAYFKARTTKTVEQNIIPSPNLTSLTIGVADGLNNYDYLFIEGERPSLDLFFFITGEEVYQPRNVTKFTIELDVWTSYYPFISIDSMFVERKHIARWINGKPNINDNIDEGFPQYEYIICQNDLKLMSDGYNGSYLFVSTSPLGMITDGTGGEQPSHPEGGGNCQATGVLSYDGFRFIKGYEGFTHTGSYLNGESFKTVGYGFTETSNPTGYHAHEPFPCTEEKASELYGELVDSYASQVWNQCVSDGITDLLSYHMFDAMVSTAWNCGVSGFLTYETSPYQLIKVNPLDPSIENVWKNFAITSNGQVLSGLVARREAEATIYFNGQYDMRGIINVLEGEVITDNNGDGFIPSRYQKCQTYTGDFIPYRDGEGNLWSLPLDKGYTSALYGEYPNGGSHYGIDFTHETRGAIRGANIYAPKDGMVVQNVVSGHDGDIADGDGFGNYVTLYDPLTDSYHIFGHMLSAPQVSIGETVSVDTVLGQVGTSGNSTGYHLHWEVRYHANHSSSSVNPIANSQLNQWYDRKGDEN